LIISGNMYVVKEVEEKEKGLKTLLNHLEEDPQPIFDRQINGIESYRKVTILRLQIHQVTGKKGQ